METRRVVRELRLLRVLRHENIIALRDVVLGGPTRDIFSEIYIVTPMYATDLHRIIAAHAVVVAEPFRQTVVYQILRALKYLHSANVIHRDLKPANVLVAPNCDVRLCDFGSSRLLTPSLKMTATALTTTLFYRAPEGLRGDDAYSSAVDLWSVGCVLAELVLRRPLFAAEFDEDEMLESISTLLPDSSDVDKRAARLAVALERPCDDALVDLLARLLVVDAPRRATATEALAHRFVAHLADPSDEPICTDTARLDDADYVDAPIPELRRLILAEADAAHALYTQ